MMHLEAKFKNQDFRKLSAKASFDTSFGVEISFSIKKVKNGEIRGIFRGQGLIAPNFEFRNPCLRQAGAFQNPTISRGLCHSPCHLGASRNPERRS
jgi:hypothetical protein